MYGIRLGPQFHSLAGELRTNCLSDQFKCGQQVSLQNRPMRAPDATRCRWARSLRRLAPQLGLLLCSASSFGRPGSAPSEPAVQLRDENGKAKRLVADLSLDRRIV